MKANNTQETYDLFCAIEAILPENREAHLANAHRLFRQDFLEIEELPDGYAFKFAGKDYEALAQYIALERLCCGFFTFDLKISANQGPIWLHIHGSEQIKAFLSAELQTQKPG